MLIGVMPVGSKKARNCLPVGDDLSKPASNTKNLTFLVRLKRYHCPLVAWSMQIRNPVVTVSHMTVSLQFQVKRCTFCDTAQDSMGKSLRYLNVLSDHSISSEVSIVIIQRTRSGNDAMYCRLQITPKFNRKKDFPLSCRWGNN